MWKLMSQEWHDEMDAAKAYWKAQPAGTPVMSTAEWMGLLFISLATFAGMCAGAIGVGPLIGIILVGLIVAGAWGR